jgi:hypothetical protein
MKSVQEKKTNVVSLRDRLETWKMPWSNDNMSVGVSSNGRMRIEIDGKVAYLDTVEAVGFMSKVSETYEQEFSVLFEDD